MLPNSIYKCFQQMSIRGMQTTSILSSSVFMKKQKQIDPEVAKVREKRKRRKLETEIRKLQRLGKTQKPVIELCLDSNVQENIGKYQRPPITLSDDEIDERAVISKAYAKSRNKLIIEDSKWIRQMFSNQDKALNVLKEVSPELYNAAIQPSQDYLPYSFRGPSLTAPIKNYYPPDGDYIDISPKYDKK